MPSNDALERALDVLRSGMQADGMDLVNAGTEDAGTTLVVTLVFGPDACVDCLVPDEMIESMLLESTQVEGLPFERVRLIRDDSALAT